MSISKELSNSNTLINCTFCSLKRGISSSDALSTDCFSILFCNDNSFNMLSGLDGNSLDELSQVVVEVVGIKFLQTKDGSEKTRFFMLTICID